ncbi:MAG: HD domain-containing protein [Candidatus Parcubacteria bacterium]|nr:HD domain-containing protein [Candidatus Parcubacteria bacterium]
MEEDKNQLNIEIPKVVRGALLLLRTKNYEAYLVGGCVRDLLLNRPVHDWDITTNAKPEEIQKLFPHSIYENQFFTVNVITEESDPTLKNLEITTYRSESGYLDNRHPSEIKPVQTLKEDLSRRDFTVNALALNINFQFSNSNLQIDSNPSVGGSNSKFYAIVDPFDGEKDLESKIIRAVGNPNERFQEDALRMIRAIRFACSLDFKIEPQTLQAIQTNAALIKNISTERIQDEFFKIIMTPRAKWGVQALSETGLLKFFLPELEEGIGITQNRHHIYTVWEHNLNSLDYAVANDYSLEIRIAALLHDIGKPRRKDGEGKEATFYNHEVESAKMFKAIANRLHLSNDLYSKIYTLVRYHGFLYEVDITTDASLRRLLVNVGRENIEDLAKVREADRIGSGCAKANPFKLRHFLFRMEKILKELDGQNPGLQMLKVNGNDLMKEGIKPGPRLGYILGILLEKVIDDPAINKKESLLKTVSELKEKNDSELLTLSEKAKEVYKDTLDESEAEIKKKYYVAESNSK